MDLQQSPEARLMLAMRQAQAAGDDATAMQIERQLYALRIRQATPGVGAPAPAAPAAPRTAQQAGMLSPYGWEADAQIRADQPPWLLRWLMGIKQ